VHTAFSDGCDLTQRRKGAEVLLSVHTAFSDDFDYIQFVTLPATSFYKSATFTITKYPKRRAVAGNHIAKRTGRQGLHSQDAIARHKRLWQD